MKPVLFHAEAEEELWEAVAYYDDKLDGLGTRFRQAVEGAILDIRRSPKAFTLDERQGTRKYVMRRFPYNIHYVDEPEVIWIAAVAHHRRHPDYWRHRQQ
jgi:toxin ParE1/3/4